jgi:hypothetical protein
MTYIPTLKAKQGKVLIAEIHPFNPILNIPYEDSKLLEYALKSQNKSFADFVEKYIFERYLIWIRFVFKLDILKNKVRFDFIL